MSDDEKPTVIMVGTGARNAEMLSDIAGAPMKKTPAEPAVRKAPDLVGEHGKAWTCDLAVGLRTMNLRPEDDATLVHWVVEAPWAHPAWHSYSIVLVHLRPMPDGRQTKLYLEGATHEMTVWAMDPKVDRNTLVDTGIVGGHWMRPTNFGAQFIEIADELALKRINRSVQDICDGRLSPDTDFIRTWARLYGDNMIKPEYR